MSQYAVALSLTLAGVFGVAAVTKLSRHGFGQFTAMLQAAGTPAAHARRVAVTVLVAEAGVAALALTPAGALPAAALATALLTVFTIGTGRVVRRGAEVRCRCFGAGSRITGVHVVRNAVLTALAATTVVLQWTTAPEWTVATVFGGSLVALLLAAVLIRFDEVVALLDGHRPAAAGALR